MRPLSIFAVLFLIIPVIEIYFLIKVGEVIGALPTIILVVLTAVIGAALLRQQGLSTLARLQKNIEQGKLPAQELIEGVLLAVGGALLMTPGFVTDTLGFLCLIPVSRKYLAKTIMQRSALHVSSASSGFTQGVRGYDETQIYEGEFTRVDEDQKVITSINKKDNK